MKTVNNSTGKPNYSQRLNPDDPSTPWNETLETCNVTAGISAITTAGYDLVKLNKGLHERPPMDLLYFMRKDPDCQALYKILDPYKANPMNEWMDVLALGISKYIGNPAVTLIYGCAHSTIIDHIDRGDGLVIHGFFTFQRKDGSKTSGGHFESLAGYKATDDGVTTAWIVDDPFGNPLTNYTSEIGNDIVMPISQVNALIRPFGAFGKDVIIIPKFTA